MVPRWRLKWMTRWSKMQTCRTSTSLASRNTLQPIKSKMIGCTKTDSRRKDSKSRSDSEKRLVLMMQTKMIKKEESF